MITFCLGVMSLAENNSLLQSTSGLIKVLKTEVSFLKASFKLTGQVYGKFSHLLNWDTANIKFPRQQWTCK